MDYYFFIDDERIGPITQVSDKVERMDNQEIVMDIIRTLTVSFDDSLDIDKFYSIGQALMELEDQVEATLTVADENKNNIIYQTNIFNYLHDVESVILQGGDTEYRYIWQVE